MVFIDTNIFMCAAGRASRVKQPSLKYLSKILSAGSAALAFTSTEVLQEILHRYRALGRGQDGERLISYIVFLGITILSVTKEDIFYAQQILKDDSVPTRDGIHAAVALRNKIKIIVSFDRDFDKIKDLRRVEPK